MKSYLHSARVTAIALLLGLPLTFAPVNGSAQNRNPNGGMGGRGQHKAAGAWLRKQQKLPPQDQLRALENDPGYKKLPPDRQQILRNRLKQFNALPPEQKERMVNRLHAFESLSPAQKQTVRQLHGELRQLPDDRRQLVRKAFRDLRNLPENQREQALKSGQFSSFSPGEVNLLHGMLGLEQFFQPNNQESNEPPSPETPIAPPK